MRFKMGLLSLLFGISAAPKVYANTEDFVILDVRTPAEYAESHVQGSLNIDLLDASFKNKITKLDKNKIYKLYCRSGNRSGQAASFMKELGFKDVENIGSLGQASKKLNRSCEGRKC